MFGDRDRRMMQEILNEVKHLSSERSSLMATLQNVLGSVAAQKTVADSVCEWIKANAASAGVAPEAVADSVCEWIKANAPSAGVAPEALDNLLAQIKANMDEFNLLAQIKDNMDEFNPYRLSCGG